MLATFFLAVSMFTISDRKHFWDPAEIAPQTQYARVDEQGLTTLLTDDQVTQFWLDIEGSNVLVLVHGYNDPEAYTAYHNIRLNVENQSLPTSYDYIIGYVWPSYTSASLREKGYFPSYKPFLVDGKVHQTRSQKYFLVSDQINQIQPSFTESFSTIRSVAGSVDVISLGMGARLVSEALYLSSGAGLPLVNNFFSWSAAVDGESLDHSMAYFIAPQQCNYVYLFFTLNGFPVDWGDAESILNVVFGWPQMLGNPLPPNVQIVGCNDIVGPPSSYVFSRPVYDYLLKVQQDPSFLPSESQNVQLYLDKPAEVIIPSELEDNS